MARIAGVGMSCCPSCAQGAPCESDTVAMSIGYVWDDIAAGIKDKVAPALDIVYSAARSVARSKFTVLGVAGLTAVFPPAGAAAAAGLAAANGAIAIIDEGRAALKSAGGDVNRLAGKARLAVDAAAAISTQLKVAEKAAANGDPAAALLLMRVREAELLKTALMWRNMALKNRSFGSRQTDKLRKALSGLNSCQYDAKKNDKKLLGLLSAKTDALRRCLPKSKRLEDAYQKELAERKKLQLRWKKYKRLWLAAKSSGPTSGKRGLFFDVATGRVTAGQYAAAGSETPVV